MKKSGVILIFLIIQCISSQSQTVITVMGQIRDSSGIFLSGATIQIFTTKDSITILTKEDGSFECHLALITTQFSLHVTMNGYMPFIHKYEIDQQNRPFVLPLIVLATNYKEMLPVTISSIKPLIIKQDTLEFHATAFKIQEGSELERLVKALPGIATDTGGNITIEGKKISRIQINSKNFSGGDVLTALRNIPADIIDKIQIIDDYGDKARLTGIKSGESEKVLNVVLKKDNRNGIVGKYEAGGGNQNKYIASEFSDLFKGDRQLTINAKLNNTTSSGDKNEKLVAAAYTDRWSNKWNAEGAISLNGDNHTLSNKSIIDNTYPIGHQHVEQANQISGSKDDLSTSNLFTLTPEPTSLLRIGSFLGIHNSLDNNSVILLSTENDSGYTKTTNTNESDHNASHSVLTSGNIYFEKRYAKTQNRFSIQMTSQYGNDKQESDRYSYNTIHSDSLMITTQQRYLTKVENENKQLASRENYYFSLADETFIELGHKWDYTFNQNSRETRDPDITNVAQIIDSLSSNFSLSTESNQFTIGYLSHKTNLHLAVGIDALFTNQSGKTNSKDASKYHFFYFLPKAQIAYLFNYRKKLNFDISSLPSFPSLQQLQPQIDLSNLQYPVVGNPNLKPSCTQTLAVHYDQSLIKADRYMGFGLGLSYSLTKNSIITNPIQLHDTGIAVQKISYVNANGSNILAGNYRVTFPAISNQKIIFILDGNIESSHTANMLNGISYTIKSTAWSQGVTVKITSPKILESSLAGNYSHESSKYPINGNMYSQFSSFSWAFTNQLTISQKIALNCVSRQLFTSGTDGSLKSNPVLLDARIQLYLVAKNKLSVNLNIYDLFNQAEGVTQTFTASSVTQKTFKLTGRYFMLSLIFRLQAFK